MANTQNNTTSNPYAGMTVDQLVEALKQKDAQINQLAEASKLNITIDSPKFGQGTIVVRGLQRFPLALHAPQYLGLFSKPTLTKLVEFMEKNAEMVRCNTLAAEIALKVTGFKKIPETTDANRKTYEAEWLKGFEQAKLATDLKPSNAKYQPVDKVAVELRKVLNSWQ